MQPFEIRATQMPRLGWLQRGRPNEEGVVFFLERTPEERPLWDCHVGECRGGLGHTELFLWAS